MIYTEGCLPKASQWFERHILPVAIVIVILAVLQVNIKSRNCFMGNQPRLFQLIIWVKVTF
jgi:hypothetical protein